MAQVVLMRRRHYGFVLPSECNQPQWLNTTAADAIYTSFIGMNNGVIETYNKGFAHAVESVVVVQPVASTVMKQILTTTTCPVYVIGEIRFKPPPHTRKIHEIMHPTLMGAAAGVFHLCYPDIATPPLAVQLLSLLSGYNPDSNTQAIAMYQYPFARLLERENPPMSSILACPEAVLRTKLQLQYKMDEYDAMCVYYTNVAQHICIFKIGPDAFLGLHQPPANVQMTAQQIMDPTCSHVWEIACTKFNVQGLLIACVPDLVFVFIQQPAVRVAFLESFKGTDTATACMIRGKLMIPINSNFSAYCANPLLHVHPGRIAVQ